MTDLGLGLDERPPAPAPRSAALFRSERPGSYGNDAGGSAVQLELKAQPLRHDLSGILGQLLLLMAVLLCPLLIAPWLWYRRERFQLNRCRLRVHGNALLLYHQQQQLLAIDLRYATRQLTGAGDLVLSEEEAHFLALGVDPPEHGYPDASDLAERRGAGARPLSLPADSQPAQPPGPGMRAPQIRTWRAVRLAQPDLMRLCAAISAVPQRQRPEAADVGSLLQALGSIGATGRRAEGQLAQLMREDLSQSRPSSLLAMLHERTQEEGPPAAAARRVLGTRTLPAASAFASIPK